MRAIQTSSLVKTYKKNGQKITALKGLNLSVEEGNIVGFLGRNGAGKSTAIKLFLGLLKPDSGEIRIFDKNPDDASVRKYIGYLPEVSYLDADFSAFEILHFFGAFFTRDKKELKTRIDELLNDFGLYTFKDMKLSTFSKGMLQKVAIIQAVLHCPRLLILDEPTAGLDPISQDEIRRFVRKEKTKGNTIFLSSHYLDEVDDLCDQIGVLHKGELLRFGDKNKLIQYRTNYEVIIKRNKAEDIIKKYGGEKYKEDEHIIPVSDREKPEFLNLLKQKGIEVIEYRRRAESMADFFLRTIGEER